MPFKMQGAGISARPNSLSKLRNGKRQDRSSAAGHCGRKEKERRIGSQAAQNSLLIWQTNAGHVELVPESDRTNLMVAAAVAAAISAVVTVVSAVVTVVSAVATTTGRHERAEFGAITRVGVNERSFKCEHPGNGEERDQSADENIFDEVPA
jgi:hypothetical protein